MWSWKALSHLENCESLHLHVYLFISAFEVFWKYIINESFTSYTYRKFKSIFINTMKRNLTDWIIKYVIKFYFIISLISESDNSDLTEEKDTKCLTIFRLSSCCFKKEITQISQSTKYSMGLL